MQPEEVLVIAMAFGTAIAIVRTIFGFAKWKIQHSNPLQSEDGNSLTQNELETMISRAVVEANKDIHDDIQDLRTELLGETQKPLLDLDEMPELTGERSSKSRSRIR